jgi:hypothetical protein
MGENWANAVATSALTLSKNTVFAFCNLHFEF